MVPKLSHVDVTICQMRSQPQLALVVWEQFIRQTRGETDSIIILSLAMKNSLSTIVSRLVEKCPILAVPGGHQILQPFDMDPIDHKYRAVSQRNNKKCAR